MNNTKLEVVRINEDVIATSGVCSHPSTIHYYITDAGDPYEPRGYYYNVNDYKPTPNYEIGFEVTFVPGTAENDKWYYADPDTGGIYECKGTHSNYTIPNDD